MLSAASALNLNDEAKISALLRGLPRQLRNAVIATNPSTLDKVIENITLHSSLQNDNIEQLTQQTARMHISSVTSAPRRYYNNNNNRSAFYRPPTPRPSRRPFTTRPYRPSPTQPSRQPLLSAPQRSANSSQPGQLARGPVKCYRCQRLGHVARNCRTNQPNRPMYHGQSPRQPQLYDGLNF